jgi:hypothetical protein
VSCGACCDDKCSTKCVSVSTTADCNTKCNADCDGSCTATANANCQEQCQESSYSQCKSELSNTCTTQCQQSTGAIFCDGSYVSADNVEQCISALNSMLSAQINATGSSSCDGGQCTASGTLTAKTSCSIGSAVGAVSGGALWPIGAALAITVACRRRRAVRSSSAT